MQVNRNVIINKVGSSTCTKKAVNYKLSIPVDMIKFLGVTKEDRIVTLEIVGDHIEIKKASKD